MLVKDVARNHCFTGLVDGLSQQIIEEMNLLVPNALVNFEDLNVKLQSDAVNPYLQPSARLKLKQAIQQRRKPLKIASAYRTIAQQYLLFEWYKGNRCGIRLAAQPSKSNHENGLALDIPTNLPDFGAWKSALTSHGWIWFGPADPPHFTYHAPSGLRHDLAGLGVKAFQQLWNKHHPGQAPLKVDGTYGAKTAAALASSPAGGFSVRRLLMATDTQVADPEVAELQEALNQSGVTVSTDGLFNDALAGAVKQFQSSKGLKADGIVGVMTRLELGLPV
jgi:peptidoglycan hydrolase-like protein with peptidoglycan-binding domain